MSRHGKRADGVAQVSVLMDEETKLALTKIAKSQKRTLSNYIAFELEKVVSKIKSDTPLLGLAAEDKPDDTPRPFAFG